MHWSRVYQAMISDWQALIMGLCTHWWRGCSGTDHVFTSSAIASTSFKLPFMGRKEEKGSLILLLFTYKGFCFALPFVPLILIALNSKICTRPHWVFNTDFWCSKLKPWFLCLWEPIFCLQNALSIILKTLGWRNDHNFPHIQTSS